MQRREQRPSATTVRSQIVLEISAGFTALPDQPMRQAKVLIREQGTAGWPIALYASSTSEGVDAVVMGEVALAIHNPPAALTLTYR